MAARHELVARMTSAQPASIATQGNYDDDNPLNLRPLVTAPSLLCVGCGGESDPLLITPCFHVYCTECMHSTILKRVPCKTCGAKFFEFKEYERTQLVDMDGNPKDERVKSTLKLLGVDGSDRVMPEDDATTTKLLVEMNRIMTLLSGKTPRTKSLSHVAISEKARLQHKELKPVESGHSKGKGKKTNTVDYGQKGLARPLKRVESSAVTFARQHPKDRPRIAKVHSARRDVRAPNIDARLPVIEAKLLAAMKEQIGELHGQSHVKALADVQVFQADVKAQFDNIGQQIYDLNAYTAEMNDKMDDVPTPDDWYVGHQVDDLEDRLDEVEKRLLDAVSEESSKVLKLRKNMEEEGQKLKDEVRKLRKKNSALNLKVEELGEALFEQKKLTRSMVKVMSLIVAEKK